MLIFLGDSFTWGQGLQFIYLTEKKGFSWEDCNRLYNTYLPMEYLGHDEDEFRKQNSFPNLVSKKIDVPYVVGRFENGGDNQTIYQMMENIRPFCTINNISCLIIQFSEPSRSLKHEFDESLGTIEEQIELQVKRISQYCKEFNLDWVGISWQPEIGDILKEKYFDNYVSLIYNGKEFTNFSNRYTELSDLFLHNTYNIDDEHLNLKGHEILAEMIYQKILNKKQIINKINDNKKIIKDKLIGL